MESIWLDKKKITKNTKIHWEDEILLRRSHQWYSIKMVLSQTLKNLQKTPVWVSLLSWSCRPQIWDLKFYEKRTATKIFSCRLYEIFRTRLFKDHLWVTAFVFYIVMVSDCFWKRNMVHCWASNATLKQLFFSLF